MDDLLLHACCGPCSTVAVPAWRERGVEPVAWFHNPNIQPSAESGRRLESMQRFSRAAGVDLVVGTDVAPAWAEWAGAAATAPPDERCATCLGLRLSACAAVAARLGVRRFATTLTVSPYQRHDLIITAGEQAGAVHGVDFVYLDLRADFRASHDQARHFDLYRQKYCGCAASKWEAWHQQWQRRRERRGAPA